MSETKQSLIILENDCLIPNTTQIVLVSSLFESSLNNLYESGQSAIFTLSRIPFDEKYALSDMSMDTLHKGAVRAEVIQVDTTESGDFWVSVDAIERIFIDDCYVKAKQLYCDVRQFKTKGVTLKMVRDQAVHVLQQFHEYVNISGKKESETLFHMLSPDDPEFLCDSIIGFFNCSPEDKQRVIDEVQCLNRLDSCLHIINDQIINVNMNQTIDSKIDLKLRHEKKEAILKAKLRAIKEELEDIESRDIERYESNLDHVRFSHDSARDIKKEIRKLERCQEGSQESASIRNYLDFVFGLPWNKPLYETLDLLQVESLLNEHHYGLEDVKERILEYLAVRQLSKQGSPTILCLAGPPGVGKTSIVKRVAQAMKRPFYRISLGGVRDEADLRGHRRSYVGALPGKVVSAIYKTHSFAPVILLDEIDKMTLSSSGDPASVLLELLDPEQNNTFVDHYMQIPVDLSQVVFISTANDLESIPTPLLNRLEIIEISGYSSDDKCALSESHLIPLLRQNSGLSKDDVRLSKRCIRYIIDHYTTDVGLRQLNLLFQGIFRKIALKKLRKESYEPSLKPDHIPLYCGPPLPKPGIGNDAVVGRSTALFSDSMVGQVLPIEVVVLKGAGRIISTGNIDPLLRETLLTAISYLKFKAETFNLEESHFSLHDFHVHFRKPDLLKKGEGWGLAIFAAIVSAVCQIPLDPRVGFAAQISLLGKVLPTRDIEQKLLAASQLGLRHIVVSSLNFESKHLFVPPEITLHKLEKLEDILDVLNASLGKK